jgi:hypothetical protein
LYLQLVVHPFVINASEVLGFEGVKKPAKLSLGGLF